MDTTTRDREIVKQVIQQYAQFKPSYADIRLDTVFDETHDRYALMQVGWDRGRRVRGNLIYVTKRSQRSEVRSQKERNGTTTQIYLWKR